MRKNLDGQMVIGHPHYYHCSSFKQSSSLNIPGCPRETSEHALVVVPAL